MSAMAFGRCTLKELAITPTTTKVDARTLERVLMSAGAELGNILEVLEVHWVLEDEILYKQIFAVLARFRSLRTLRLYRDSPPPPPHLPPPLLPLPSTSSPLFSSHFSLLNRSSPSFPPTPSAKSRPNSVSVSPDMSLPRLQERSRLALWQKSCPALRNVVFLSGAEWRIRPSLPGRSASPVLEFIGYAL
ncbi:hypothetical protein A0H81_07093 [Grifola frondosa]|uniref:Uncharacterized protein n=1 Tax=Grifola frondosa TaxID=5627 RepID=A0A1C7M858_GRIFR|nr:hypothetical protein A0H81_07093 [Grifola frondosa]